MPNAKHTAAEVNVPRRTPPDKRPDAAATTAKASEGPRPAKSRRGGSNSKILRISFLVPRDAIPRLEWLMKVRRIPTKVDLLREALNFYEDKVIEEEAGRAENRRLAGAPPLTDRKD